MKNKKSLLAMIAMMVLVAMLSVGGTMAWLSADTTPVKNTFTPSTINITLTETTTDYKMVPGNTIAKDPKATVIAGSEDCWLFVKIDKSANYDTYLNNYEVAEGWKALDGVNGVYYREVAAGATDQEFPILKGNQVTVKQSVTLEQMNSLTEGNYPTLTFTAYAVQKANITKVEDAWTQAGSAYNTNNDNTNNALTAN